MENSAQAFPVQQAPVEAAQPAGVAQTPSGGSGGSKMALWFVAGLVLILVLVGGVYFLLSRQQTSAPKEITTISTPLPTPKEDLESDLNSINAEASDSSDFTQVDRDLQSL